MSEDFLEAVLTWKESGPNDMVKSWFMDRGFGVTQMQTGLLITGDKPRFEKEFPVDLTQPELPLKLQIPAVLSKDVASITIPAVRKPYY
jgi:hypothetical protein